MIIDIIGTSYCFTCKNVDKNDHETFLICRKRIYTDIL